MMTNNNINNDRCVNPFVHRFRFRTSDYISIIIGTVLLLPIRIILILSLFMLASVMAKLVNVLLKQMNLSEDREDKWRTYLRIPVVYTFRAVFFLAGFYRFKITDKGGPEAEKEAPIIVIAPHTSPFDVVCGLALGIPSVVARHDSVDIPLFGDIIKMANPVFVERDSQSSRSDVYASVLQKIKYNRIVFFPEGTCGNRRALCQFKSGAFKLGLPVQPMIMVYDQGAGPDTLSWTWDGTPVWQSIWLTLCRWTTGFELIKLPVYYPSDEEKNDPDLFAHNVTALLSKQLDMPYLSYSYDDVKYLSYNVYRSPVCLKFLKLCDKIAQQRAQKNALKINNNYHTNSATTTSSSTTTTTKKTTISNGVHNSVTNKIYKRQLLLDTVNDIVGDIIEKLELNSVQDIDSIDEIISLFGLDKDSDICKSITLKDFYTCLTKTAQKLNTGHLAVVINLCDLREKKFSQRLATCFKTLSDNKQIDGHGFRSLLWLAFGIDKSLADKQLATDSDNEDDISYDEFLRQLFNNFGDCVEQNARVLLKELSETDSVIDYQSSSH
ncbi:lysophosphatidylcholine acyltransferase 1-like [Oppia nitens]|uniref:lysophosphatidylcholine acyltransferase 1-like n=1 Tax=Oppia nitens TaxID=1686743 RepID=UPI0023DA27D4|nr:lysophosphatidylcholine acyltransferase 1-like [Oppia nitens]XP_054156901.1 lysophosphatidylcholine acyltransferase 1-like [Oppia nitens]XP_054156902.1 lysophosphatidylcholine acyltransferase 1-like [Oppia nitens]